MLCLHLAKFVLYFLCGIFAVFFKQWVKTAVADDARPPGALVSTRLVEQIRLCLRYTDTSYLFGFAGHKSKQQKRIGRRPQAFFPAKDGFNIKLLFRRLATALPSLESNGGQSAAPDPQVVHLNMPPPASAAGGGPADAGGSSCPC